jgi:hypothetical protein
MRASKSNLLATIKLACSGLAVANKTSRAANEVLGRRVDGTSYG